MINKNHLLHHFIKEQEVKVIIRVLLKIRNSLYHHVWVLKESNTNQSKWIHLRERNLLI
jgi:hypothetical protein